MQEIMVSIRPRHCANIASREKTIEARKTRPQCGMPFRCYIYETRGRTEVPWADGDGHFIFEGRGQVIGEFVCNEIKLWQMVYDNFDKELQSATCLTPKEFFDYTRHGAAYLWHISDLVIYDEPKELSDFGLKWAPQSWCYVKGVGR